MGSDISILKGWDAQKGGGSFLKGGMDNFSYIFLKILFHLIDLSNHTHKNTLYQYKLQISCSLVAHYPDNFMSMHNSDIYITFSIDKSLRQKFAKTGGMGV